MAGCVVAFISFGFVVTFGVFLKPISDDLGWGREVFSLSMAVQLLSWGVAMPFTGMLADRYGSARILAVGAVISAVGFALRGAVADPTVFILSGVIDQNDGTLTPVDAVTTTVDPGPISDARRASGRSAPIGR